MGMPVRRVPREEINGFQLRSSMSGDGADRREELALVIVLKSGRTKSIESTSSVKTQQHRERLQRQAQDAREVLGLPLL